MDVLYSLILGIIEGLTEFLPVSSTGHLLVASAILNFPPLQPPGFRPTFDIFIQIGAVVAVLIYYARDLIAQARKIPSDRDTQRFWLNIFIAFLPAAVIGLVILNTLEKYLETPISIGIALILGGIVFLLIERNPVQGRIHELTQITPAQALGVGVAQVVSLVPGVSRSGASIVGGLLVGMDRLTATTFSFYLFIPTLGLATLYRLFSALKDKQVELSQLPLLAVGTAAAFVLSYVSIAWLLRFVSTHTFRVFGIYRIVAGLIIIVLALLKVIAA